MSYKTKFYPESKFGGFTDIDGIIIFYLRVNSLIKSSDVLLDIECGLGDYDKDPIPISKDLRILKGKVKKVIGIDVDKETSNNPLIDEFYLIDGNKYPIEDNSIDIVVCDNVLEHVENPEIFFKECKRIMKNDAYLCLRTPNLFSYFGIFSKLIPNKYHGYVKSKVQEGVNNHNDCYPTFYKCNTIFKLKKILKQYSFENVVYGYEPEPGYLSFSKFFYFLGVLHQKYSLKVFSNTILAFAQLKKRELNE